MGRVRRGFCKLYRAMSSNETCEAGIEYAKFKGTDFAHCPCFYIEGGPLPTTCEHAVYPTPEELAIRDAWLKERFARTGLARQAIVDSLGGPWKKGVAGSQGAIECPVCQGRLSFSRSGYNGHIHAKCSTAECVSWME